jgi:hypothetical protein
LEWPEICAEVTLAFPVFNSISDTSLPAVRWVFKTAGSFEPMIVFQPTRPIEYNKGNSVIPTSDGKLLFKGNLVIIPRPALVWGSIKSVKMESITNEEKLHMASLLPIRINQFPHSTDVVFVGSIIERPFNSILMVTQPPYPALYDISNFLV